MRAIFSGSIPKGKHPLAQHPKRQVALWIVVEGDHAQADARQHVGQVIGQRGLADAALVVKTRSATSWSPPHNHLGEAVLLDFERWVAVFGKLGPHHPDPRPSCST